MRTNFTRWTGAAKALAASTLLIGASALPAAAQTAYGLLTTIALTGTASVNVVTFQATAPGTFTVNVPITGLAAGQALVGLDTRPATGQLFALGYNDSNNQAQLYTLNATTGALTAVGTTQTLVLGSVGPPLRVGFDFNPTVDRIRVTAGNRANYRLNPNNGTIAATDGSLTYATTDANASQTPSVGSSAYTNSYIGSTATTLYNFDEAASRLVTQVPPNDGTLNTVGPLGVTTSDTYQTADLDIYYNRTTGQNTAYMSLSSLNLTTLSVVSNLYTVNLATGTATSIGALSTGSAGTIAGVSDIAFAIDRTVPAAITGQLAYALAGTNLLTFDTALPGTIRTSVGITGVDATQTLVGLDVRPANNALYALGYNAAAATGVANSQLYTLNAVSGVASPLGAAFRLELGTGAIGFDFNPTVDRIRVVGANRNNYRLNPTVGAANVLAATDGTLTYNPTNNLPMIGAVAYTNSVSGPSPATTTTLYNYDITINQLNIQATANPPADGQLTAVGPSGIAVNNTAPAVDLDIYSPAAGTNTAYLVANTGTSANTSLYTVNLATGAATLVGAIGNGLAARNIAVAAATGVVTGTKAAELASDLSLFPNPLAGTASLSFGLPRATHVELTVTDALGRTVDHLDAGQLPAGPQTLRWNRQGQGAGLYFFRLRFDGQPAGTRQAALTE
ncbi:MAG: DUF4394 domain-containing protein [Hymenobacter sp.]|nr:MAG: DUF4394 domain-containing protein [Hymenobacter sp.]